ncbi:hypothetical protein F5878DRAFT_661742 [Lentinula raphanica]|uniref:Uncharacterized protein n=1 Tax=Lentinula raphanica TaxID=153919 RepID=A0AA38P801_9AGAR|nr:hypothetical protein F5878DRAFT_661742 [Lentinula raphanica]
MSFSMTHSVILPYPLDRVFSVLSDADQMERLQKLTPEAQEFSLLPSDVTTRAATEIIVRRPRCFHGQSSSSEDQDASMASHHHDAEDMQPFSRTHFEFSGTVPILFGLINRPLSVSGAQIVDKDAKVVLFESGVAAQGIREIKLRTFREIVISPPTADGRDTDDDSPGKLGMEVKETVWGSCPFVLSFLLKYLAPKVHREHMELYQSLFDDDHR